MREIFTGKEININSPDWKQDNPITDKTRSEWKISILLETIPSPERQFASPEHIFIIYLKKLQKKELLQANMEMCSGEKKHLNNISVI